MSKRVVVDPVERVEGHLRVEATVDDDGVIRDARAAGTTWRGIETVLEGRDPRDAWAFCERVCGVCTTVHALASVRAVEDALGVPVPPAATAIRNVTYLAQMIQDHVTHFYQLHLPDWVDVSSALRADAGAASALARRISPGRRPDDTGAFAGAAATLRRLVDAGRVGILAGAYRGHPAHRMPPETSLVLVAHHLEWLTTRTELVKLQAIFGGRNPNPSHVVGGTACSLAEHGGRAVGRDDLARVRRIARSQREVVERMYYPDALAVASSYPEWTRLGGGVGNYLAYGDLSSTGDVSDVGRFRMPRGAVVGRDFGAVLEVDPTDPEQVEEAVDAARSGGPAGDGPRWRGRAMEVGPLARVLVGHALRRADHREVVGDALGRLGAGPEALFSTVGRTLARALEARLCAAWLEEEVDALVAHVEARRTATADTTRWSPNTWPAEARGFGHVEASRGALGHWVRIRDGKIASYRMVTPTAWNGAPRDRSGQAGAIEASLLGTPLADPELPLEVLRTVHSFAPCLACAAHEHGAGRDEVASGVGTR